MYCLLCSSFQRFHCDTSLLRTLIPLVMDDLSGVVMIPQEKPELIVRVQLYGDELHHKPASFHP